MKYIYLTSFGDCVDHLMSVHNPRTFIHMFVPEKFDSDFQELVQKFLPITNQYLDIPNTHCDVFDMSKINNQYDCLIMHGTKNRFQLIDNINKFKLLPFIKSIPVYVGICGGASILQKKIIEVRSYDKDKHIINGLNLLNNNSFYYFHYSHRVINYPDYMKKINLISSDHPDMNIYLLDDINTFIYFDNINNKIEYDGDIVKIRNAHRADLNKGNF